MAQTIHCDSEGCVDSEGMPTEANWLVSRQDAGETLAWCDAHYVELCRAVVAQVDSASAEPAPAAAEPPQEPDEDEDDTDALARLQAVTAPASADPGAIDEQAGGDPPPVADPPATSAEPANVVRRGTSRSRRAHQAKVKAKAAKAEADPARG